MNDFNVFVTRKFKVLQFIKLIMHNRLSNFVSINIQEFKKKNLNNSMRPLTELSGNPHEFCSATTLDGKEDFT